MKYQQSEWMTGLLFAEEQSKQGWKISNYNACDQYFEWEYKGARQTVFGECEWLDGVLDYYKQQAHNIDVLFKNLLVAEKLGPPFAQILDDNFWDLVLI